MKTKTYQTRLTNRVPFSTRHARNNSLLGVLAVWLLILAPAHAETATTTATATRPFLWKITGDGTTAYLLGSIHAATDTIYPLNERIDRAYALSDILVVEANILEANPMELLGQIMTKSVYPEGETIADHVSPDLWTAANEALQGLGLEGGQFQQLQPWFLAMSLTMIKLQAMGVTAANGIDLYFLQKAANQKPVLELEGAAAQLELLSGFSRNEQELFLRYTLAELDQLETSIHRLLTLWKEGDADGLAALLLEGRKKAPDTETIYRKLFDERNVRMAKKIEEYLASDKTHFIVVGAGHLVGEQGLLKLLAEQYRVTQE